MEVHYKPQISWRRTYQVITLSDSELPFPKCFPCAVCNECLDGKEFFEWNSRKYCWECFATLFGHKCCVCRKSITGISQMTFIYYDNQTWHSECFKCNTCGTSLAGCQSQNDKSILCTRCGTRVKFPSS